MAFKSKCLNKNCKNESDDLCKLNSITHGEFGQCLSFSPKQNSESEKFKLTCKFCESIDVMPGQVNIEGEEIKQEVKCHRCLRTFTIWSKLNWEVERNQDA